MVNRSIYYTDLDNVDLKSSILLNINFSQTVLVKSQGKKSVAGNTKFHQIELRMAHLFRTDFL